MGFRQIFEAENGFQITPVYKVDETLELARLTRPELVIFDVEASVDLSLLRNLKHLVPEARVILWVSSISAEVALQAVNLGVLGIIPKTAEPVEFIRSVREVQAGGMAVERSLIQGVSNVRKVNLSKRESELVTLIAQGLRNKEIAARLSITENTVKAYLSRLFEKVKVDDRLGLALYGLTNVTSDVQALRAKLGSRPELDLPNNERFTPHSARVSEQFAPVHP